MTATEPLTTEQTPSPRLQQFQAEVEQLKVTGGKANPERTWSTIGAVLMALGVVLSLVGWLGTRGTTNALDFADYNAMGNLGMVLAIVGTGLFMVMSLRRYFRYWLVRMIYEHRDQVDRIISSGR